MTAIKICGLKDSENLKAAAEAGARFAGFVFYPKSPRFLETQEAAALSREAPPGVRLVGLFVDPADEKLEKITRAVKLDMIQLHGEETPARILEIKTKLGLPVMKAIRVGGADDLAQVAAFEDAADWLLFDAKDDDAPGGTGKSFDWNLLKGKKFAKPWMLSGGLNAGNVKDALKIVKPDAVDVSSGVESARGVKDPAKIREFIKAVKEAP